ncbi:MAG: nicotinate (nicotinamide) nucleotide adenylyltransferase [Eubacterium sp.]|jgi:nicotinate-nucleotide adenylyltransferase|nr:nicotinate (nicotinamide) nucleotide adenylyltransferase [Eubacterium sp.]MCI2196640.1 nicotinate (nicotinamide) nucleotide adenylyltransferase [Eubacterium sp.]
MKKKPAAVLGGTFNPIHLGHISIAEAAAEELHLHTVYLMPAHVSPFKLNELHVSDEDRLAMVRIAAQNHPRLSVLDYEIRKQGISYTWDTLEELSRIHEDTDFWFIVGGDSFLQLKSWSHGPEILSRYGIILTIRPGISREDCLHMKEQYENQYGARISLVHNDPLDISSTEIRRRAAEGKSLKGLVPREVEKYIYDHRLYR